eukprot:CAMPEP_0182921938 /NCGR_PEP_ID=MMETSP0105_2-20130417/4479_1 /TAXON_ID=81532 ORGANISM="Acanthoeca-like sp., Strain 10tr" /NCGR_SAMPLE_ID=MMETSP0105_2 /ASSEMBLY_ACC=CAM_ASM_000205 /LENGTH=37 /DNA_ID= /DNA_START= /DNA_END= /DNA_ORIENTATION=
MSNRSVLGFAGFTRTPIDTAEDMATDGAAGAATATVP